MVCGFSLYHIFAFFLIYSCLGWCLEVIYAAATTGQLVNRGFLNGPVCPIYGFGMIIVLFALTPLQNSVLALYIGGVILPSALELVGGWALEKIYHTRWWDYSDFPFNIGGYICLEFCLLWGVGTLVVMKAIHPVIAGFVDMIPQFAGLILMCILYAVYAVDVVATAIAASGLSKTLDTMEQLADSIHAVSNAMTQLLGITTLNADQKLDEQRLQLKLAAAQARENAPEKRSMRDTMAAVRAKADEAMAAARHASETAKLNAAEAAEAAKLAAKGTISATAQGERDAVLAAAATVPGLTDLRVTAEKGGEVSFTAVSESGADLRGALSLALAKAGCPVLNLRAESMSLEDVFLQLTEAPEETETTETETNEQEAE